MSHSLPEAAAEEHALSGKRSTKRKRLLLEANAEQSAASGDHTIAKALGSPDFQTRDKALLVLTRWLKMRPTITHADLNKIWKGLFYTFWHSDKQPVQETLAERLARILPQLQPEVGFAYWSVFMETMRREWFGIDRLRLDKFMMLARAVVRETFEHLRQLGWDSAEVAKYGSQLSEAVLRNEDARPDLGFVFHLSDCWVPELLNAHQLQPIPQAALETLLQPFVRLLAHIDTSAGITRVTRGAFETLLEACDPATGAPAADFSFLHGFADSLFAMGASKETKSKNREALYTLSRRFHKAAEQVAASGPLHPNSKTQSNSNQQQQQQDDAASISATTSQQEQARSTPKQRRQQQQQPKPKQQQPSQQQNDGPGTHASRSLQQQAKGTSEQQLPPPSEAVSQQRSEPHSQVLQNGGSVHRSSSKTSRPSRLRSVSRPSGGAQLSTGGTSAAEAAPATPRTPATAGGFGKGGACEPTSTATNKKRRKHQVAEVQSDAATPGRVNAEPDPLSVNTSPAISDAIQRAINGALTHSGNAADVGPAFPEPMSASPANGHSVSAAKRNGMRPRGRVTACSTASATVAVDSPTTPDSSQSDDGRPSTKRKSVQFVTKRNLYFERGGPQLPPDVRTPPGGSRYPGSALRAKTIPPREDRIRFLKPLSGSEQ